MNEYLYTKKQHGFSLIELLVVITIIGILVTIVSINFNDARDSARNKAVQAGLSETQLALEVYKAQNGRYPSALPDLQPDFMSTLLDEDDSGNSSCSLTYETDGSGTYYKYTAANCFAGASEASEGIQPGDEYARCPNSCTDCAGSTFNTTYKNSAAFYESLAIYSSGGQCE